MYTHDRKTYNFQITNKL